MECHPPGNLLPLLLRFAMKDRTSTDGEGKIFKRINIYGFVDQEDVVK